jgi:hypothetical protein
MIRIDHLGVTYYIDDQVYNRLKTNVRKLSHSLYDISDVIIKDNVLLKCRYWSKLTDMFEITQPLGSIGKFQLDFTDLTSEERDKV